MEKIFNYLIMPMILILTMIFLVLVFEYLMVSLL